MRDNTRIDCLTNNYAVEFDFAHKWYEAVGQSLHYARLSGETPAIVLIIEQESDWRFYWNLKKIARTKGISVYYMKSTDITH